MIEIPRFGLPIFCFSGRGIQSHGQIPPLFHRFSLVDFHHRSNHRGNLGETRSERREKKRKERGKEREKIAEFRPFAPPPRVDINVGIPREYYKPRARGSKLAWKAPPYTSIERSTPRFGAVTTDEFRMSPANGKQRNRAWSLTPPQSFHVERLLSLLPLLLHFPHTPFLAPSFLPPLLFSLRPPRSDRTVVQRGGCGVAYVCKSWPGTGGCGTLQSCEYACTRRVQRATPPAPDNTCSCALVSPSVSKAVVCCCIAAATGKFVHVTYPSRCALSHRTLVHPRRSRSRPPPRRRESF